MKDDRVTFSFTLQEHQYLVNLVMTQPIREALPIFLKLTQQGQSVVMPENPKEPADVSVPS